LAKPAEQKLSTNTSSVWGGLFQKREPWCDEVTNLWLDTPFFKGIPAREIRKLSNDMHARNYQAGEFIFHQGDQGAGVAMIKSGTVEIRYEGNVLATLHDGDFFGEIALVLDELRTADAVAIASTELVLFLRPDFEEWIKRAPQHGAQLSKNLAYVLAHRLMHANKMLAEEKNKHVIESS